MIGNDIIDLDLAKTESNWKRRGYLDKIFMESEKKLIHAATNPEQMVWILWSCKESAYKIYNRATLERSFIPLKFECKLEFHKREISGTVQCFDIIYFIKTQVEPSFIYTIAVTHLESFQNIRELKPDLNIVKKDGVPFLKDSNHPISITHHGKFERRIQLELC